MAEIRPPQTFRAAFENGLRNRTGIVVTNDDVYHAEMARDLNRSLRLGGFSGDEIPGNEALKATDALAQELSDNLQGPDGLLQLVEKLGPLNPNVTSEKFIKPFFGHLNLSQLNIISFDADITKFSGLTNLDISRNSISNVNFLSPNLQFLKVYNNKINQITCSKQPSLSFLGAGYNALETSGLSQLVQRFRGLLSLDLCYNNLTSLKQFLDDVQVLSKMKHLCVAGNPLCLLPYYRLVVIKNLPNLQLLDEQVVKEEEVADSQLVDHSHLQIPSHLNVAISFSEITYLKRLLTPLAEELPATKVGDDEVEVPISLEDRVNEVAQKGQLFFRVELPGWSGAGSCFETTEMDIEKPPEPEDPKAKAKAAPKKGEEEPPPKPPGDPLDLTGLLRALPPSDLPPVAAEPAADSEAVEAEAPPTSAPLFFPLPLLTDNGRGAGGLLKLRNMLRTGMKVKALYRRKKEPVDPDAVPPAPAEGEEDVRAPTPAAEEPRLIGGGRLILSAALWPVISPVAEDLRQDPLPALPPAFSIGPKGLQLAPESKWLEPDVQVMDAAATKSLSDVSASVTMDVVLYAKEAVVEEDAEAA